MDTIQHLENLLLQIPDSDADIQVCARVFDQFIDSAISAARSKGLTNEGSPVSLQLQNLQSTRSNEVERAKVRYEKAFKTGAPKKRWAEYYEAEEPALFHMKKDMRLFIQAYQEALLQHSAL